MLERDLQYLGSDLGSIPECLTLPDTASVPGILGSLYVSERATLSGQILSRHFTRQFPVSPTQGCWFFSSYGDAVGQRWREFCDRLALYSRPPVFIARKKKPDPILRLDPGTRHLRCLLCFKNSEASLAADVVRQEHRLALRL